MATCSRRRTKAKRRRRGSSRGSWLEPDTPQNARPRRWKGIKMEERISTTLDEIRQRLALLRSHLPARIDAREISLTAKLPFNALWYRETLAWRMAELSQSAFELFEKDGLSSAILLTRGAVETSAAL